MAKTIFKLFPSPDKTGNIKKANRACADVYSKEYQQMKIYIRDEIVAKEASDNGRCWWIYQYLKDYPFRLVD